MPYVCEKAGTCPRAKGDNPCIMSLPHEHITPTGYCEHAGDHVSDKQIIEKGGS